MRHVLIFGKSRWISTQYQKFLAGQNDPQAIFVEGQTAYFRIFMRQNPGLRVKHEPWECYPISGL